jgi:hypothetical protein
MRTWILLPLAGLTLLAACDGSSTTSNAGGGGAGGDTSSTTSDGGGGSSSTGMTTSTDTTTSTTTMTSDPCESATSTPAFFANEVQPIFSQRCGTATSCHLGSLLPAGLSLKPGEAYAALVNVDATQTCNGQKRVAPGSAVDSYLVNKITATNMCPLTKKMPPSITLPDAEKQKLIDWVCQGAENN